MKLRPIKTGQTYLDKLTYRQQIGLNIRLRMKAQKVGGADLAKVLGFNKQQVWRIFRGERILEYHELETIAQALNCEIFNLVPESKPDNNGGNGNHIE